MQSLLLEVVSHAATGTVAPAASAAAASATNSHSLLSSLAFNSRAFLTASTNSTLSALFSKGGVNSSIPLSTLLPTNSTLLLCSLAVMLYALSWIVLAGRDGYKERTAYVTTAKAEQAAPLTPSPATPALLTVVYSLLRFFVFLYRCGVFLVHAALNRAVPFRKCSVYLRGFSCAQMPDEWTVSSERFRRTALQNFGLDSKATEFCMKLLGRSGLGECTYFPPGIMSYPPDLSMQSARAEADYIFSNALDQLFEKTGIKPKDVDILIVNCSLFAPTPSLAAMIMKRYKMREDCNSYNLSGMGCSAGLISIHLAKDLLRTHPNSLAVIVSTELITQQIYTGNETNMLLQNSLFRTGGAAIALSNRSSDYAFGRCVYELEHTVRTTLAADAEAYGCVFQDEDKNGRKGVRLEKSLMEVAGKAMKKNISRLGPLILPYSEQLKFALNLVARTLDEKLRIVDKLERYGLVGPAPAMSPEQEKKLRDKEEARKAEAEAKGEVYKPQKPRYKSRIPEYTPNFKTAVDHICIHAGGRAVIDAIQAGLKLTDEDVLPSRATLKRYGNTSSSSIWYEFRFCEQHRGVKPGEHLWQLGFGSGFKCNSAVWRKL